jgi:hypothetical protein
VHSQNPQYNLILSECTVGNWFGVWGEAWQKWPPVIILTLVFLPQNRAVNYRVIRPAEFFYVFLYATIKAIAGDTIMKIHSPPVCFECYE